MEVLQRQEEQLKSKLEDADTIIERRKIRAELREIRNKIANFSVNKDENSNIIGAKDLNANTILPSNDFITKSTRPVSKIMDNEPKLSNISSPSPVVTRKEPELRLTDENDQLRVKPAEERANRRARRQERMAKLAKEQSDDTKTNDDIEVRNEKNTLEEKNSALVSNRPRSFVRESREKDEQPQKTNLESKPRSYEREVRTGKEDIKVDTEIEKPTLRNYGRETKLEKEPINDREVEKPKFRSYENVANSKIEVTYDKKEIDKPKLRSFERDNGPEKEVVSHKKEIEKGKSSEKLQLDVQMEKNEDKRDDNSKTTWNTEKKISLNKGSNENERKNVLSQPEKKSWQMSEKTASSAVNAPSSFTGKFERKEERTVVMKMGDKKEEVKQTFQSRSSVQNGEQTTHTKTTVSRTTSAFDRFNGGSSDASKKQAANTIGKALNFGVASARNKFMVADKDSTSKPVEVGLNFTKKFERPGYTVKKLSETKAEQKNTSSAPMEFGLSFLKKTQTETRSNLKETGQGSAFKKTTPTPHPRHQTAPAITGQPVTFKMPGGGTKASSVADRMKMFKESQAEEKARMEKQKEKEAHHRARLASDPTPVKSPTSTTAPCLKKREVKKPIRRTMSISSIVLDWCKEMVKDYGIEIRNFSGSWSSGLAFCALIHKFNPDQFDFNELTAENRERNFQLAFDTAFEVKKIPKLLDVEDMVRMQKPEPRSVQCYVQWIWSVYGPTSGYGPSVEEIKQAQVS